MTQLEQSRAAKEFSENWRGKGDEKSETHNFWIGLLRQVFGVENAEDVIQFEKRVMLGHKSFIDGYIENTLVLIEQKSHDIDLRKAYKQSDGELLTPFEQAHRYASHLKRSEFPRWIITCNFKSFLVYDMENPQNEPEEILLENLEKEYHRLSFIAQKGNIHIEREEAISKEAGRLVGLLYDALSKQYENIENQKTQQSLNALCVRLVFCLYAEDAGLFGSKSAFHDYMRTFNNENFRTGLVELFKVLDTPEEKRDKYLKPSLKAFPYVNGGLFASEEIEIPYFTDEIIELLLEDCSAKFDWSDISPTIFGAVFESTLNPETRRSGGMHYTSIENIHKVIDPLFLNSLKSEFNSLKKKYSREQDLRPKLFMFQEKLSRLKFLDPACGSGNFLTESYISLRRLENSVIELLYNNVRFLDEEFISPIKVTLSQFYGIEINDFAVSVAKAAMWIAESQMQHGTENIVGQDMQFFPLKDYVQIVEGNALELDWSTLRASANVGTLFDEEIEMSDTPPLSPVQYDYIMGNPPFVGARLMSSEQKNDLLNVFGKNWQNIGNMDYVSGWYKKAFELIKNKNTKCALVSTNSITQGEQDANLWKPLFEKGLQIDFAYRTFRWDSESFLKAHVHCVIVGFSDCHTDLLTPNGVRSNSKAKGVSPEPIRVANLKIIFDENGEPHEAKNINGYLIDAPNIFIESRSKPICDVPQMDFGNMPNDAKGMLSNFSTEEKNTLCKKYPELEKIFHKLLGAEEYINNKERWCLWFKDADLSIIRKIPEIKERIEKVREARAQSKRDGTRKLADYPYLFGEIRQPETNYIIVPSVSSEKRKYIPMGFLPPEVIVNNAVQIIPNATLYEFGVLTSSVHMAWTRAVCGRLKSDYRYSKDIVYNNFVWPVAASREVNNGMLPSANEMLRSAQVNNEKTIHSQRSCDIPSLTINCDAKRRIEQTAQAILNARAKYPDCSLADLYDENTMPPELRRAHNENDKAVMQAYGFGAKMTEAEIVAELMGMYQRTAAR